MSKGRMEAFSDGVIAILITIMVLGLKVPEVADVRALEGQGPVFVARRQSWRRPSAVTARA